MNSDPRSLYILERLTRRKQLKLWRALAGVGALGVDAGAVLARLRVLALVDVGAVAPGLVQGVAAIADAPEDNVELITYCQNSL